MKRDFSEEQKQKLLQMVEEVKPDGPIESVKDWFSDIGMNITKFFGGYNINDYLNKMDDYHRAMIDKDNVSAEKINQIFSDVESTDDKSAVNFRQLADLLADHSKLIENHCSTIQISEALFCKQGTIKDINNSALYSNYMVNTLNEFSEYKDDCFNEIMDNIEKKNDLYMQDQIFDLLDTEEYNKQTWIKATEQERQEILISFYKKLKEIYGVDVAENVVFSTTLGNSTRGQYSHSSKTVTINQKYLSKADSYQIMYTMIHEMRHAYQHAAVDNPDKYKVSEETIRQWENNIKPGNYKSTSNGYTYSEYVSQPIEYDAKNFAKQSSDLDNANPEYKGSWDYVAIR